MSAQPNLNSPANAPGPQGKSGVSERDSCMFGGEAHLYRMFVINRRHIRQFALLVCFMVFCVVFAEQELPATANVPELSKNLRKFNGLSYKLGLG
jgi:hypothetical protein